MVAAVLALEKAAAVTAVTVVAVAAAQAKLNLHKTGGKEDFPIFSIWVFPKIGVGPQNGWFIMENPIKNG